MSSLRQIEANRRNAKKSTGPTSVTGKAVSFMNALKTGIHAESLILPSENLADLDQLTSDYYQHHHPANPDTRALVDELIYCEWMLRRLRLAETQAWLYQSDDIYRDPQKYPLGQSATCHATTFSKLQYRLDATRRARLRALRSQTTPGRLPRDSGRRTRPARTRSPVCTPFIPNHFTPNWLRSANSRPRPTSPGVRTPEPAPDQPAPAGSIHDPNVATPNRPRKVESRIA